MTDSSTDPVSLADSSSPGNGDIVEDKVPGQKTTYDVRGTHDQETRKQLACIILIPLVVLYVLLLGAFLLKVVDASELTTAIAALSGFQVLAAAAVGFYFGSKE